MLFTVYFFGLVGTFLATASVQRPELISCANDPEIDISDVFIWDAQIGKTMTTNFTLTILRELALDHKVRAQVSTPDGWTVRCYWGAGSCTYRLCGGNSRLEQIVGHAWENKCPVPAITTPVMYSVRVPSYIQIGIGTVPTTLSVTLKVTEGKAVIGCRTFTVDIAAEDS